MTSDETQRGDAVLHPSAAWVASLLLGLGLGLEAPMARADGGGDLPLVTDRPDQTESARTVPPGAVQIELGWLRTRQEGEAARTDTRELPGTLMRFGAREGLELRLGWQGWTEEEERRGAESSEVEGEGDLEVGVKVALWEERGPRPQGALLASLLLPTGDEEVGGEGHEPSLRLSFAHTLSESLSLGYNLGLARESERTRDGQRESSTVLIYTAALGVGLTGRLGTFIELFGDLPVDGGRPRHSLDGGFTFLLHPALQLDLSGGLGLSREAPDWFVGLGLSVRFPLRLSQRPVPSLAPRDTPP